MISIKCWDIPVVPVGVMTVCFSENADSDLEPSKNNYNYNENNIIEKVFLVYMT